MDRSLGFHQFKTKLLSGLFFGLLVVVSVAMWGDFRKLQLAVTLFDWQYAPLVVMCVFTGYLGRLWKWQLYMGQLQIAISLGDSARIFFSGFAMALTPGKVGEVLRSLILKNVKGIEFCRSAPTVLAERFTDLLAMLFLASFGASFFPSGAYIMAAGAVIVGVVIFGVQYRPMAIGTIDLLAKIPYLSRMAEPARNMYEGAYLLFRGRILLQCFLISVVSWFMECIALYLIFVGYKIKLSLLTSTFILSSASIVGGLSMLPGGLGVAEVSMVGMLVHLEADRTLAIGATMMIRFGTLWFGVLLGLVVLRVNWKYFGLHSDD